MKRELDAIDLRILNELQANGRLSIVDLAARVNLTKTPCSQRVRRLENDGVISGYSARIEPALVGLNHLTVVHVTLNQTSGNMLNDFANAVADVPEIISCLMIAGQFDFSLQVLTRDIAHFRELLGDSISNLPGVMQTHSFAVMESVKATTAIKMTS